MGPATGHGASAFDPRRGRMGCWGRSRTFAAAEVFRNDVSTEFYDLDALRPRRRPSRAVDVAAEHPDVAERLR